MSSRQAGRRWGRGGGPGQQSGARCLAQGSGALCHWSRDTRRPLVLAWGGARAHPPAPLGQGGCSPPSASRPPRQDPRGHLSELYGHRAGVTCSWHQLLGNDLGWPFGKSAVKAPCSQSGISRPGQHAAPCAAATSPPGKREKRQHRATRRGRRRRPTPAPRAPRAGSCPAARPWPKNLRAVSKTPFPRSGPASGPQREPADAVLPEKGHGPSLTAAARCSRTSKCED